MIGIKIIRGWLAIYLVWNTWITLLLLRWEKIFKKKKKPTRYFTIGYKFTFFRKKKILLFFFFL